MDDQPGLPAGTEPGAFDAGPPHPPDPRMATIARTLERTAPWTRLLAILGFISVVLMVGIGLVAGVAGIVTSRPEAVILMLIYPVMGLLYFFPSLYLLQYTQRIREYIQGGNQLGHLEIALEAQRKFWFFVGILTVVGIAISLLGVVAAIGVAFLARGMDV